MQQVNTEIQHKIVSHRLRNFDSSDATIKGLRAAASSNIFHVEIDSRQTKDGEIVVHHDPWVETRDGKLLLLIGNDFWTLRTASTFPLHLHIDVKSRAANRKIFDIASSNLQSNQYSIVSWMPEVLQEFQANHPEVRLFLSNISTNSNLFFSMARVFQNARLIAIVSRLVLPFSKRLAFEIRSLDFRLDIDKTATSEGEGNTVCIFNPLPSASIVELLSATHGYVCLPNRFASQLVVEAYKAKGIDVALF